MAMADGIDGRTPPADGNGDREEPPRGAMAELLAELARAPEDGPSIAPGDVVGERFEILREVGRGAFGLVFEARDRELGRLVAVKTLRPRRGLDAAALRAEAEAAAQLHHPNIVTVHDLGRSGHEGWLVLELLRGETLEQRLRRGALGRDEAVSIATDVARGLAHAHRSGVLHRDLKPGNVFLCDDGAVKILDFGLSHVFGAGSGAEGGGTPAYAAPEQWRREPSDERADVFSLGVMVHEMLTGGRPYGVEGGRSAALDDGPVPEIPAAAAPRQLRQLVRSAISRRPEERPRDGAAFLEALLRLRVDAESGWFRSRSRLAAGLAAGALLAGAVAAVGWAQLRRAREAEPPSRIPVAVADFTNATSDPELSGLSGMLITALEQSRRLTVLTRSRLADLLRQAGREVPERIDEPLAREVGRVAGVKALLLATVHRFDDLYAIEMRALDPAANEYLFTLKEEARGKSSVPGMIDRLAARTREKLRERPADLAAPRAVAEVTTRNLAAYERYFKARQALDLLRTEVAQQELAEALRIDPDFALAHYQRAVVDAWSPAWLKASRSGDEASVRTMQTHLATALQLADRLPDKERLALLGWKATLDKDAAEAQRLRDQAAESYPQDKEAVFWAGDVRFHAGRFSEALPYFDRALALDPGYVLALDHVARGSEVLGRPEAQLAAARRWIEVARSPEALRLAGRALLSLGRREEALRSFREASDADGRWWPPPALGSWLVHEGRPHDAEQLALEGLSALPRPPRAAGGSPGPAAAAGEAPDAEEAAAYHALLVAALFEQGRIREARSLLDRLDAGPAPTPARPTGATPGGGAGAGDPAVAVAAVQVARLRLGLGAGLRSAEEVRRAIAGLERAGALKGAPVLASVAAALARAGDASAADRFLARARSAPDWGALDALQRELAGAAVDWGAGRGPEAEAALRRVAGAPTVSSRYVALALLGELLLAGGRGAEGAEALERARALPWNATVDASPFIEPRVLLGLARAYEQRGDAIRARAPIHDLLRLWERADPDLPGLAEARELHRRVSGQAQATQR